MQFLKDLGNLMKINHAFEKKYWWQCTLVSVLIVGVPLLIDYAYYKKEEKKLVQAINELEKK